VSSLESSLTANGQIDPVTATGVHRSGGVVATSAGPDHFAGRQGAPEHDTLGPQGSRLKLWSVV
jgi:hypothetical protein